MRRYKTIIICMFFAVLAFGSTLVVHASVKTDAMKAYNTQLQKASGSIHFGVIYLDKDSVPELVLNDGRIYSYKKGKGIYLLHEDYEYDYKTYYKKTGVIYSDIIMGAMLGYDVGYYSRMTDGKLVTLGHLDRYPKGKGVYYNADFKEVSKSVFDSNIKKYTGSKKAAKIKYYKNTAGNRKKVLK